MLDYLSVFFGILHPRQHTITQRGSIHPLTLLHSDEDGAQLYITISIADFNRIWNNSANLGDKKAEERVENRLLIPFRQGFRCVDDKISEDNSIEKSPEKDEVCFFCHNFIDYQLYSLTKANIMWRFFFFVAYSYEGSVTSRTSRPQYFLFPPS